MITQNAQPTFSEFQHNNQTGFRFDQNGINAGIALRSYLAGCTLSTAGSSATMSIAAGVAMDSTNNVMMTLAATSKTTASWAVGSAVGGLDTGAIANSTWYHFYVIRRPDTGVVDCLFSTSATSPTLPSNYTQFRRIGSGRTNGSAQWTSFVQDGDLFQWLAPVADVAANNPGTAAVTRTLTVPTGVNIQALIGIVVQNTAGGGSVQSYSSDLATNDVAPSSTFSDTAQAANAAQNVSVSGAKLNVRTNTSAQVRSRLSYSDASVTLNMTALGWIDTRGRNA